MKKTFSFILSLSILALTSCSGSEVKRNLGLEKSAPDEFSVISYPPLVIPPSLSEEKSKKEDNPSDLPLPKHKRTNMSAAESAIVDELAGGADKDIKEKLKVDSTIHSPKGALQETFSSLSSTKEDPVLDPKKEKQRLDKLKKDGKNLNHGKPKQGIQ